MIKETVCNYCSYRFSYKTTNEVTWCPICGATQYTKDIVPIRSVEVDE